MDRKLVLVAFVGLVAIHVWGFGFSWVFYQLFLLVGRPEHPTPLQWYPAVVGLSFLFGFLGALVAKLVAPHAGSIAALVFLVSAGLSFFASTLVLAGASGLVAQLSSYGFWGFILGSMVGFAVRRRVDA